MSVELRKKEDLSIAIPWDESVKFTPRLMVEHTSYLDWQRSILPQIETMTPGRWNDEETTKIPIGEDKVFYLRTFPYMSLQPRYELPFGFPTFLLTDKDFVMKRTSLKLHAGGGKKGNVWFTDDVVIPILAQGRNMEKVWMSLTPMEIMTQRVGVGRARGNVLIGGLGMGWFARRVLDRSKVKHVTIAELDPHVLDFFGGPIKDKYGDRVELVNANVYDLDPHAYDSYLLDIWPAVNDVGYDRKFQAIKATHKNAWGWGYK
jgi:hypothetical protein